MIEIKNTGSDARGVLVGNPKEPSAVKVLQPGESFVSDSALVTVTDDTNLKDRRDGGQGAAGRRVADPRVDQRQVQPTKGKKS